jgi:hypothetical protein
MREKIKNRFMNITKDRIMLISGVYGFTRAIKNLTLTNNTNKTESVNIYLYEGRKKIYLEKKIVVVPKTKLELFDNKNIILKNVSDAIYVDVLKETSIDIFCNYIDKFNLINMINLVPNSNIRLENTVKFVFVEDNDTYESISELGEIKYEITDSADKKRKVIKFKTNEHYKNLKDIEYLIDSDQVIVFKNGEIKIDNKYVYSENYEKYVIKLYSDNDESMMGASSRALVSIDTSQPDLKWRYVNISETRPIRKSEWLEQRVETMVPLGNHYIEIEGYETPFVFTFLRNNLYNLYFNLENCQLYQ